MTQSWLGLSINFTNVEDKTSESSNFELLKEGFYRATIKSANRSVLGANNKPALTITLTLDDCNNKEIVHNLFLPEATDKDTAKQFKEENLRNFFTRFAYNKLTKEEYSNLTTEEVNAKLQSLMTTQPNFAGAKILVHIKQEPFISRDKATGAIKFTSVLKDDVIRQCTQPVLKLIQAEEQKGVDMFTMPVILFSNKVAAHGFGFYNDYDENAVLKDSKSFEFIQSIGANVVTNNSNESSEKVEEPAF